MKKKYKCVICGYEVLQNFTFKEHMNEHQTNDNHVNSVIQSQISHSKINGKDDIIYTLKREIEIKTMHVDNLLKDMLPKENKSKSEIEILKNIISENKSKLFGNNDAHENEQEEVNKMEQNQIKVVASIENKQELIDLQIFYILGNIISSLYAMFLVAAYISLMASRIVHFPTKNHTLKSRQFLVYLLSLSIIFLIYILCYLTQSKPEDLRVWANNRSHGSAFLRQGAIIFGLGNLIYATLEFISFFQVLPSSPCYDVFHPIAYFLNAVFTVLQVLVIVRYPRLNISKFPVVAMFGLMHLITTNVIIWIHTLVKESFHELIEVMLEELKMEVQDEESNEIGSNTYSMVFFKDMVEKHHRNCREEKFFDSFLGDSLINASTFLFAFIIEFTLIGATVFYCTWIHVGPPPPEAIKRKNDTLLIPKLKPADYISKMDCSHSLSGFLLGLFVTLINIVHLGIFFSMASIENNIDEFISDVTNTALNILGIIACVSGLIQIQNLENKYEKEENGLDLSILNISGFFMYFYSCLTIIVGFNAANIGAHNELIIINGIVEIFFVTLQITFLVNILQKRSKTQLCSSSCHPLYEGCKPGRQAAMFLILLNISQWIIATFELQKSMASPWEKTYYGFLPWAILQRLSVPLCTFFRFHSAVIAIDIWKNVYKSQ